MIAAEKAKPFLPKKALPSSGRMCGKDSPFCAEGVFFSDEESPGFTGQDAG